jgi:hypothetical protein
MSKWGKKYWEDLGERVVATAVESTLGAIAVTGGTPVDWSDWKIVWSIIGIPTAASLLKGLLSNLSGDEPTASVADVTSSGEKTLSTVLGEVVSAVPQIIQHFHGTSATPQVTIQQPSTGTVSVAPTATPAEPESDAPESDVASQ